MAIKIKTIPCFVDSANEKHETKLQFLIAEQKIRVRGIIQSDEKHKGKVNYSSSDLTDIVVRNAEALQNINREFSAAIKRARINEKPVGQS